MQVTPLNDVDRPNSELSEN